MTKPYWVNLKYALQRVPFVLKGRGFLSGLNELTGTVQKELLKSEGRKLCLDFVEEKVGAEATINSSICELMRRAQVRELNISVDTGGVTYSAVEFPEKELGAAIKFALRELAMNGMPRHPKEIDFSSTKSAESHRGYQLGVRVNARASLGRVSIWGARLSLFYHIDAGRVRFTIVSLGKKIDG